MAPTLALPFVGAALAAALVGSAVVVGLESAARTATGTKRHAIASRDSTDDRKDSRIFASKQMGTIPYQKRSWLDRGSLIGKSLL